MNGIKGVGKTTHAREFSSYLSKMGTIVRWINSDFEDKIYTEMKKIINEILKKEIDFYGVDRLNEISKCFTIIARNNLKEKNILFVLDSVINFEWIKILIFELNKLNNVQILITTTDDSCRDILTNINFISLKVDYFNEEQAKLFMKKSKRDVENDVVEKVLKLCEKMGILPHQLNFIVNIMNTSNIDFNEYLKDNMVVDKSYIFSKHFSNIESKNIISMKILYFIALLDPDKIQYYLLRELFNDVNDESFQEAIDLLTENHIIENQVSDNKDKYYRIQKNDQELIDLYRKNKNLVIDDNHEFENKLLNVLSQHFHVEFDLDGILMSPQSRAILPHLKTLLNKFNREIFKDERKYSELKLKFQLAYFYRENSKIIDEIEKNMSLFDDQLKLLSLHMLGYYYYHKGNYSKTVEYFEKEVTMMKYYDDCHVKAIGLYSCALIYHEVERKNEALKMSEESLRICKKVYGENNNSTFKVWSLIIKIRLKLEDLDEADVILEKLFKNHEKQTEGNYLKYADDKLFLIAKVLSVLERNKEALQYVIDALEIYKDFYNPDDFNFGAIYLHIAEYYRNCGDYMNTEIYLNKTLIIFENFDLNESNSDLLIKNYYELGELLFSTGRYYVALYCLEKYHFFILDNNSLISYSKNANIASFLLKLGRCYLELDYLDDADEYFDESIGILKKIYPNGNLDLAKGILEKSRVCDKKGKKELDGRNAYQIFTKQNLYVKEAIQMIEKEKSKAVNIKLIYTNIYLSDSYCNLKMNDEAKNLLKTLLVTTSETVSCKNKELKAIILYKLGNIDKLNPPNLPIALLSYEESLKLFKEIHRFHPQISDVLRSLAFLWHNSREEKNALKLRLEALKHYKECFKNEDNWKKVECLKEISQSYEILSEIDVQKKKKEYKAKADITKQLANEMKYCLQTKVKSKGSKISSYVRQDESRSQSKIVKEISEYGGRIETDLFDLIVSENAVKEKTTFFIKYLIKTNELEKFVSPIFELGPHSIEFSKPVILKFKKVENIGKKVYLIQKEEANKSFDIWSIHLPKRSNEFELKNFSIFFLANLNNYQFINCEDVRISNHFQENERIQVGLNYLYKCGNQHGLNKYLGCGNFTEKILSTSTPFTCSSCEVPLPIQSVKCMIFLYSSVIINCETDEIQFTANENQLVYIRNKNLKEYLNLNIRVNRLDERQFVASFDAETILNLDGTSTIAIGCAKHFNQELDEIIQNGINQMEVENIPDRRF